MKKWLCLVSILLLGGCAVAPVKSPTAAPAKGEMSFSVRWPDRQVQTIPAATQEIRVDVRKDGVSLVQLVFTRPVAPATTSTQTTTLDAGSGYSVVANAYATTEVQSDPIATGSVGNITVIPNQKVPVPLTLTPVP